MEQFFDFLAGWKSVTTGLSLVAFVVAGVVLALRWRHLERLAAINREGGDEAIRMVDGVLTALRLDTHNLTKDQRFALANKELDRIARRQMTAAILIGVIAVIFAAVSIFAISRNESAYGDLIDNLISRDMRLGSPAARTAAVSELKRRGRTVSEGAEVKVASQILSAGGPELCNLLLSAFLLSEQRSITPVLRKVATSVEYQLKGLTCAPELRPEFTDRAFEDLALVRPNLSRTDFTRSTFKEVVFRDEPDYAGTDNTDCRIQNSTFVGTEMSESSFSGCNLSSVSFNSASFDKVNIHRSTLNRVNFNFARLKAVRFLAARLIHVDMRNVKVVDDVIFGPRSAIDYLRIDYSTLMKMVHLPKMLPKTCLSLSEANQCWDDVSQERPECHRFSAPGIYAVTSSEAEAKQCVLWENSEETSN